MLLTRAPLGPKTSFDLHVWGMPPAFVLSHNQTLKLSKTWPKSKIYGTSVKAEYFLYNKKYLLIRIPLTFVIYLLRIVVYVSLYYLINKLKSIEFPKKWKNQHLRKLLTFIKNKIQNKRVSAYNSIKIRCQTLIIKKKCMISKVF